MVEFWSVNLLERSVWTQEVLSIVHVSTRAGSMVLHHTTWGKEPVEHIGRKRDCEGDTHHKSRLRRGIQTDFHSAVGLAKSKLGQRVKTY